MKDGEFIRPGTASKFVFFGVILFFLGTIIIQSTIFIEPENYDDSSDYYNRIRDLTGIGKIFNWIGVMIIALPLYSIGIGSEKLDWKIRASMLTTGTALVVTTMIVTMFNTIGPYY
jgi:hypothetical protein